MSTSSGSLGNATPEDSGFALPGMLPTLGMQTENVKIKTKPEMCQRGLRALLEGNVVKDWVAREEGVRDRSKHTQLSEKHTRPFPLRERAAPERMG